MKKMSFKRIVLLIMVVLSCALIFSCGEEEQQYTVIYSAAEGGKIVGSSEQYIEEGGSGTEVTAVADDGLLFIKWSDGNKNPIRCETDVRVDKTLTAIFSTAEETVSVNYGVDNGGSIVGKCKQLLLQGGNAEQVVALPDNGYLFIGWSDGIMTAARTDVNVTTSFQVTANFEIIKCQVAYSAGENGTIQGELIQTINYGEDASQVTAVANEGYMFIDWSDGVATPSRVDSNVTKNFNVVAKFERVKVWVSYHVYYGSVEGTKEQMIVHGEDAVEVTAVADKGYRFVGWSDGVMTATRKDTNVTSSFYVYAICKELYYVNYLSDGRGIIEGDEFQWVLLGESTSEVAATPFPNCKFIGWSDGIMAAARTDKITTSSFSVTANFEIRTYQIKYSAGLGGSVTGELEQTVKHGESSSEVTAIASRGFKFVNWSDGLESASRMDTNIKTTFSVTANFAPIFDGGNGTEYNPYLISSYEQFLTMQHFPNYAFRLMQDLDLSGIEHIPLFDSVNRFHGYLNGNGHTIKNLTIDTYTAFPSLLGFVSQYGLVDNLNLANVNITVPNFNTSNSILAVGAVCGVSLGRLDNIHVSGKIDGSALQYNRIAIGGLVGQSAGTITNCHMDMNINLTEIVSGGGTFAINVGGMVGVAENNVINSSVKGIINVDFMDGNDGRSVGGMVGSYVYNTGIDEITITNCYTETAISTSGGRCGGLIGYGSVSTRFIIIDCYTLGNINNSTNDTGGFFGKMFLGANSLIENCYTSGNIINQGTVGGFAGYLDLSGSVEDYIDIKNCYVLGNVEGRGHDVGGFAARTNKIRFYRSYVLGNVTGVNGHAAGFVHMFSDGFAEECFTTGDITSVQIAAGFAVTFAGSIKNCYSTSNIYFSNPDQKVTAAGLICSVKGSMENCYFAGKIIGNVQSDSMIGALMSVYYSTSTIKNCHWLKSEDGLALSAIYRPADTVTDTYAYNNILEMSSLADILNTSETEVWVNTPNSAPKLKFMIES